ncbi:MAG: alpha/beta fold hydrolase, partial [Pyrinomonadaceae bacterium]|nr:alpha/beta fold hydrolase [Sphingobacteriaceae bacterium]
MKHILFIQGGGGQADHETDSKLVASLQEALGEGYKVHYPFMSDEPSPDFGRIKQIKAAITAIKGDLILVGHSLGASMLLKYLSDGDAQDKVKGVFLIATPFWSGDEDWKEDLKLHTDFADSLPRNVPIFLYHCEDDEEVPFEHLGLYQQNLPKAKIRK